MKEEAKTYPSKRSIWFVAPPIVVMAALLMFFAIQEAWMEFIIVFLISLLVILPVTLYPVKYMIEGHILKIDYSLMRFKEIDIQSVRKVKKIKSYLNIDSAATSANRLELFYNTVDSFMISPVDEQAFIAQLKQINPAICTED